MQIMKIGGADLKRAHVRHPHENRPVLAVQSEVARHLQHRYQPVAHSVEMAGYCCALRVYYTMAEDAKIRGWVEEPAAAAASSPRS
jgi:hypothetical protein